MKNKRILIVAAHPDDEILGCGATVAKLIKAGCEAFTVILGEGITSRDNLRNIESRKKELIDLKNQIKQANEIIGIKEFYTYDFPDNRFDTVPLLDIIKKVEEIKSYLKPDVIFTHFKDDLNIDHKITYNAVLTATRPLKEESVKEIYSFEILSSTEWSFPLTFSPNIFYDINKTIEVKKLALAQYTSEVRNFPHPRSIEGIDISARNWGMKVGLEYTEAFMCIRNIVI